MKLVCVLGGGESGVSLIGRAGVGCGDRIVGLVAGRPVLGKFAHDGAGGDVLAGGVFDFDDPGEGDFRVRIVHLHGGLPEAGFAGNGFALAELLRGEGFVFEAQRAVGQGAETTAEVFIDRAGEDEVFVVPAGLGFLEIHAEVQFDAGRGGEQVFKQRGVAVRGQRLESFR